MKKAVRLELLTLAYIVTSATLLFFTMGSSQAMRTSFLEEVISSVPALAFLIGSRIALRRPSERYPYGFHGAVGIGFLVASLALFAMGAYLLIEAALKVLHGERTAIGGMHLFGHTVWAGWPMLAALVYAGVPAIFLGRAKRKLAPEINDKVLHADGDMMNADWKAETATAAGVIGVGLGFWWMDPLAAALVSVDIMKDGVVNLKGAVADLIEREPSKIENDDQDPLIAKLQRKAESLDWVEAAEVRLRRLGHVMFGEVFVVPNDGVEDLALKAKEGRDQLAQIDWRLHDLTLMVMDDLPPPEGLTPGDPKAA